MGANAQAAYSACETMHLETRVGLGDDAAAELLVACGARRWDCASQADHAEPSRGQSTRLKLALTLGNCASQADHAEPTIPYCTYCTTGTVVPVGHNDELCYAHRAGGLRGQ